MSSANEAPNKGVEIIKELYKSPVIPPYRLQQVQEIKRRIVDVIRLSSQLLAKTTSEDLQNSNPVLCRLNIQRCLAERWKRYLAVYFYQRWHRIRCLNWFSGGGRYIPDHVTQYFAPHEKNASDEYDKLLQQYIRTSGIEITTSITPPVAVNVEIEVLQAIGTIQVESGTLTLVRGSRHFVRRRDVEHLIRRKMVREVQSAAGLNND